MRKKLFVELLTAVFICSLPLTAGAAGKGHDSSAETPADSHGGGHESDHGDSHGNSHGGGHGDGHGGHVYTALTTDVIGVIALTFITVILLALPIGIHFENKKHGHGGHGGHDEHGGGHGGGHGNDHGQNHAKADSEGHAPAH